MKTITDLLTIRNASDPRSRELLLAHVLAKPREWVLTHPGTAVRPSQAARYRRLLRRHIGTLPTPTRSPSRWEGEKDGEGEPLPYLLGERWFYGRPFIVNRNVLVPRSETELLIELAIARTQKCRMQNAECRIIDVGTGSGCIAVTLAAELLQARIIATDASPTALRVARANAQRHSVSERISFLQGNLLEPIEGHPRGGMPASSDSPSRQEEEKRKKVPQFCILPSAFCIVANLPYLTTAEWRALPRSIRAYEPREALDGGPDGLTHFRQLFTQLTEMQLAASSSKLQAFFEIDPRRKHTLTALVRKTLPGWRASWHRDLAGCWRVLELQGPTVYDPAGPRSPARS